MRSRLGVWRNALLLVVGLLHAAVVRADDIVVMTSGAFTAAYLELAPGYERSTKDKVVTATMTMGVGAESIPSRLRRGEAADVVIMAADSLDQLIKDGLVVAGSRTDLARSAIGMAVRAGARKPDISSVEALRRTLLEAQSVAYSFSVSGDYLVQELFPKLGIADAMKSKGRRIERERVGAVVARGEAEIGFQQMSELLPVAGIDIVGPLPPAVQRVTVIAAGVAAHSKRPEAARAFVRFLASPAAADAVVKSGMEPIAVRSPQAPPSAGKFDFSGVWVLESPAEPVAGVPSALSITQPLLRTNVRGEPVPPFFRAITIARTSESGTQSDTWLIGVEGGTVGGVQSGGADPPRTHHRVAWEDRPLIIERASYSGPTGDRGAWREQRESLSLDPEGRLHLTTIGSADPLRTVPLIYRRK